MALNIVVCVKSVIHNALPGKDRRALKIMELNPFDRPVLDMALSLVKKHRGSVTVVSMGPNNATFGLHQAMAMGADRAVLISDPALKESDTYVTARVLGTAVNLLQPFDLVLFGTRSSDSDTGHVGPQTAEMLNLPFIGNIHRLALQEEEGAEQKKQGTGRKKNITGQEEQGAGREKNIADQEETGADATPPCCSHALEVEANMDGYLESYALQSPAAFTVGSSHGSEESTLTSLYGIENAFENRSIEFWNIETLGLQAHETGLAASPTKIIAWNREKRSKECTFIDGAPEQKAEQLAEKLLQAGLVG